ncbi:MAG: zinc ribbon domain-containing protein [Clostridia bacterium]|nr:zinc ribbon domain-containing protein [Clostridia bacterium]
MFTSLRQQILALNADVSDVTNSEKAKKLRKKLLCIGIPLTVLGFGGVILCFILFTVFSIQSVQEMTGFSAKVLVPFFCLIPCALVGGIGASLLGLIKQISLTGYTAKLIQDNAGFSCPVCKKAVTPDKKFCGECGAPLVKVCPKCQKDNAVKNNFCDGCGEALE